MNKKYQFFISSQRRYLENERSYAFQTILELGHIPVGVDIVYPESKYLTEEYAGKYIDSSQFVIFILSDEYGSISDFSEISFIEEEYNYAVSLNKPIVCFIDADYHFSEDRKQRNFIQRILNNHNYPQTVCYWKNTQLKHTTRIT